jgi:hypothetical protein
MDRLTGIEQNLDEIHALEGVCSLAATGATAVKGGNWQIFQRFLQESRAKVHLNTTVRVMPYLGYPLGVTSGALRTGDSYPTGV